MTAHIYPDCSEIDVEIGTTLSDQIMNPADVFRKANKDFDQQIENTNERPACNLGYDRVYLKTPWALYSPKSLESYGC